MAFNPITAAGEPLRPVQNKSEPSGKPATRAFEELLANSSRAPGALAPDQARSMAALMQLEMMASLVSWDTADTPAGDFSPTLERFLAAMPTRPRQNINPVSESRPALTDRVRPHSAPATAPASAPATDIDRLVDKAARRFQVAPALVKAVIKAESSFDPQATSPAGAQGLMQLMPATARELGVDDSYDPEQNIMGGTRYLRQLLDRYQGDVDQALAAYNWGMGNLERSDGSLPRETRNYQVRVKQYFDEFSRA